MTIRVGTVHDRYEFLDVVGEGGMSVVYRARHTVLGSKHAVKVLRDPSRSLQKRLIQEGRLQSNLKHPHIVNVTDVLMIDDAPALVMEYVEGPSLAQLLRSGPLTLPQIDAIGREILQGVAGAHAIGLVHRDLKPANIMLAIEGDALRAKITDFGLAKPVAYAASDEGSLLTATTPGAIVGTPAYMAPEQISDASQVDARSDIFALGAVLYELISGQRCFPGATMLEVWTAINAGRFIPLEVVAPGCSARMREVVSRSVVVDREARAEQVAELLAIWTEPDSVERTRDGDDLWAGVIDGWRRHSPAGIKGSNSCGEGAMLPTIDSAPSSADLRAAMFDTPKDGAQSAESPQLAQTPPPPGGVLVTRKAAESSGSATPAPRGRFALTVGVVVALALTAVVLAAVLAPERPSSPQPALVSESEEAQGPLVLVRSDGTDARRAFTAARGHLLAGNLHRAESDLHQIMARSPDEPAVHHLLAVTYLCQGELAAATAASARAQALGRGGDEALAALVAVTAKSVRQAAGGEALLKEWEAVLTQSGKDPLVQVSHLAAAGHLLGAEATLARMDRLERETPGLLPALTHLALQVKATSGSASAQVESARAAVARYPDLADYKVTLAGGLVSAEKEEEALWLLRSVVALADPPVRGRALLATLLARKGDEAGRMEQFMLALGDTTPAAQQQAFLHAHAVGMAQIGRTGEARKMFDFCARQGDGVMAVECALAGVEVAMWLESTEGARQWISTLDGLLGKVQVEEAMAAYYRGMLAAYRALIGHRDAPGGAALESAAAALEALPKDRFARAAAPLAHEMRWQVQLAAEDTEAQAALLRYVDAPAAAQMPGAGGCHGVLTGARAAFALRDTAAVIRGLERVASGQCAGAGAPRYVYLKATALAMLVETYASLGDRASALKAEARFTSYWPAPDASMPLVQGVQRVREGLEAGGSVR